MTNCIDYPDMKQNKLQSCLGLFISYLNYKFVEINNE